MVASPREELDRFLRRVAADRARICLPLLIAGIAVSLVSSETVGVPISRLVLVVNVVVLATACALFAIVRVNGVGERHGYAIGALAWLLPPITTLAAQWDTGVANLSMLILLELAMSTIQVSTVGMIATTSLVF